MKPDISLGNVKIPGLAHPVALMLEVASGQFWIKYERSRFSSESKDKLLANVAAYVASQRILVWEEWIDTGWDVTAPTDDRVALTLHVVRVFYAKDSQGNWWTKASSDGAARRAYPDLRFVVPYTPEAWQARMVWVEALRELKDRFIEARDAGFPHNTEARDANEAP